MRWVHSVAPDIHTENTTPTQLKKEDAMDLKRRAFEGPLIISPCNQGEFKRLASVLLSLSDIYGLNRRVIQTCA